MKSIGKYKYFLHICQVQVSDTLKLSISEDWTMNTGMKGSEIVSQCGRGVTINLALQAQKEDVAFMMLDSFCLVFR